MAEFAAVIEVIERLLGPGGCPWDQEQTMMTIRSSILEEVYEVIEAIDACENPHTRDELGDLLFNVIFLCKLAEKENRFTLKEVLQGLIDKLIRRHPHVFGKASVATSNEVIEQWDRIKHGEAVHAHRKSLLDGIPKDLPSLAKAQKIIKKMKKINCSIASETPVGSLTGEEELGEYLFAIVQKAEEIGLDAEQALRSILVKREKEFRSREALQPTLRKI